MLRLVLPKGSLERATLELFAAADLGVVRGSDVDYRATHRRPPGRRGADPAAPGDPALRGRRPLRPRHHRARLDRGDGRRGGLAGRARYSKATANPIRVVLAVAEDSPVHDRRRPARPGRGCRPSTPSSPGGCSRSTASHADIRLSYGATEAKIPDIADAVVEITETGRALAAAGLRIVETLLVSRTELIANPASAADAEQAPRHGPAADPAAGRPRGAGQGAAQAQRGRRPTSSRRGRRAPGARSRPTVSELSGDGGFAVETVVPKSEVNVLIPALKDRGATDIIELPLSKIVH